MSRIASDEQPNTLTAPLGGEPSGGSGESGGAGRFFYGWVMLPIATAGAIATSPAQTYGLSAFNESFRHGLGLSHSELTGAYMIGTLLASLPMGYVGSLMDRHGPRRTMTAAVLLFGLACLFASQATGLFTLFLAFFLLRMIGQGAMSLISANTLAFWFDRRLGTVEGVRHLGMAGAIAIVPALNLWLISAVGWRWAYAALGLAVWAGMLPLLVFLSRDRPEDIGQRKDGAPPPPPPEAREGMQEASTEEGLDDPAAPVPLTGLTLREALRTRSFWIVATALSLWGMTATAVLFNILPLFASRGLGASDAALLFTTFAVSLAVMHVIGGVLADRMPLNLLIAAGVLAMAGAMGLLRTVSDPAAVPLCGILMGMAQGLITAASSPLWPRYFGRAHLGKIRGLLATLAVASTAVGPFLIGATHDLLGSYEPILTVFTVVPLPLALLALFATPPKHSCS